MSADLGRVVDDVVDALRFACVEADAREDLSTTERRLLVALAADTADQLDRWLATAAPGTAPLVERLAPHLPGADAAPTAAAPARSTTGLTARATPTVAARRAAETAVHRATRRLLLPARAGVGVGLLAAALLWSLEVAQLRNQGTVVLLTAGIGMLALGLLAATAFSPGFVSELGSGTGAVLTRAGSTGRHVEQLFAQRTGSAVRALTALGAPVPRSTTLLRVRASVRAATGRVYAGALLVGLALFLGMTRALGLL
ncbi:MAG: hypothetical protein H5T83_07580 [Actinotalea sp.]|nr:hypothetical protein [Actinotalea sp.]